MRRLWGDSKNDVYAVGSGIRHTRDAGATWQELGAPTVPALTQELGHAPSLMDVWSNGEDVYVVGERGVVLHSADAGATFARVDIGAGSTART